MILFLVVIFFTRALWTLLFVLFGFCVQDLCKEIYEDLGAEFLAQLFEVFGEQFAGEVLLMLQAHFCASALRADGRLGRSGLGDFGFGFLGSPEG